MHPASTSRNRICTAKGASPTRSSTASRRWATTSCAGGAGTSTSAARTGSRCFRTARSQRRVMRDAAAPGSWSASDCPSDAAGMLFAGMATVLDMSDLAGLELGELESELATLAAHLSAGTCRWLELVGELDRRGGWAEEGAGSCAAWVAWRCGLTARAAREHVRVARRLAGLPQTRAAFAHGVLSYAKVRALTRVATAESEGELLELAGVLTAAQLERTMRAYRRVTAAEAREQLADTYLSVSWNADGSLELQGRLAPEDGALLLRALEAQRDSSWEQ